MKTKLQTNGISFTDPKIVAYIEEQNLKGQAMAKLLASNHVLSGKPPVTGGQLKTYIEPIYTFYNCLLAEINDQLQSKLQIQLGAGKKEQKGNEDKEIRKQINNEEATFVGGKKNSSFLSILFSLSKFFLILIMSLAIYFADILYLSRSLQIMMDSYFNALMLGMGVSFGCIVLGFLGEYWISNRIQSKFLRNILRAFLVILILSVFIYLGILRQQFSQQTTNHESPLFAFVAINMVLFIALFLLIEMSLVPTIPEVKEAFWEMIGLIKANKIARRIAKLKGLLTENRNDIFTYLEDRLCIIAFHQSCESKIERYYYKAISIYKQIIINETEGDIPKCLDDEIPQLIFLSETLENKRNEK